MANVNGLYLQKRQLVERSTSGTLAAGGGGEYPLQAGFGWTNGVMRRLMVAVPGAGECYRRRDSVERRALAALRAVRAPRQGANPQLSPMPRSMCVSANPPAPAVSTKSGRAARRDASRVALARTARPAPGAHSSGLRTALFCWLFLSAMQIPPWLGGAGIRHMEVGAADRPPGPPEWRPKVQQVTARSAVPRRPFPRLNKKDYVRFSPQMWVFCA